MTLVISGSSPSFSGTYQGGVVTSGTAVASTSGTYIDFTSIPSWVKRITVMFNGVSENVGSNFLVQIGDGSVNTTGYSSRATYAGALTGNISSTAGYIFVNWAGADTHAGHVILTLLGSNTWVASVNIAGLSNGTTVGAGIKTLSGTLDRVRITTVSGTSTFDAGSINILYE